MRYLLVSFVMLANCITSDRCTAEEQPAAVAHWSFESLAELDVRGQAKPAAGAQGMAIALDGYSLVVGKDSSQLTSAKKGFTVTAWVNPYGLNRGQQMIVAKNRYSLNERQWGVMIDEDSHFRLYVHQAGWQTVEAETEIRPGHWYQVAVVVQADAARLFVNGELSGSITLKRKIPDTAAPLSIGGVDNNGRIMQTLWGAIDDVVIFDRPLSAEVIAARYQPVAARHEVPQSSLSGRELWEPTARLPTAEGLTRLDKVQFHVIKPHEPDRDGGYGFLHGIALAWHKGRLFASWGHNKGRENTASEEARGRFSKDGGKTWSETFTIDSGDTADELAVSHGVFLSRGDELWALMGAFHGDRKEVHTRAYVLDESTDKWDFRGVVIEGGFWPMEEPVQMQDGNWIMGGIRVGGAYNGPHNPAAVAISRGDDLTHWELVVIPNAEPFQMWGESTTIVNGKHVLNIARFGGGALALAAVSDDYGRSWTASTRSNLPMATSKPYAGLLSTGQRYLVCTTTANSGGRRWPLTIAVSRSEESPFCRVLKIRDAVFPAGPGDSHPQAALSYPYAIEREGRLYVAYSNNGGRKGMNINSAELAIIPIEQLRIE